MEAPLNPLDREFICHQVCLLRFAILLDSILEKEAPRARVLSASSEPDVGRVNPGQW